VIEEDPEYQLTSVCQAIKSCMVDSKIDPKSVAAIGIDGQMAGVIGVDDNGKAVTPYDSWLDTRCEPYIKLMGEKAGDLVVKKAGNAPSYNHGPKKLWWMHEHPEIYKTIRSFVQPGGYVAMRLCGLDGNSAFIDHTYLHFSGFADNQKRKWDTELCNLFNLDPGKLPRIVQPQDIIGTLIKEYANQSGLVQDIPVIAGCGDTAASFLACGATEAGVCVDVAGTASVFAATTDQFGADIEHQTLGCGQSAVPGLWHPYAYINGGGMTLEWFKNEIINIKEEQIDLEDMNILASQIQPDATAPFFIPHFGGRVSPPQPYLRGGWMGITWGHSAANLYRSILESVALEYGIYASVLGHLFPSLNIKEIRITGGGEKSCLWNQIKSDALGIPVVQIMQHEGTPLGSALLAGWGIDLFTDLKDAADQWIHTGEVFQPDTKKSEYYSKRQIRYEELLTLINRWSISQ
jgi:xylulokinase